MWLRSHRVIDGGSKGIGFGVDEHYRPDKRFSLPGRALMPRTGWRVRPTRLLVPRDPE